MIFFFLMQESGKNEAIANDLFWHLEATTNVWRGGFTLLMWYFKLFQQGTRAANAVLS